MPPGNPLKTAFYLEDTPAVDTEALNAKLRAGYDPNTHQAEREKLLENLHYNQSPPDIDAAGNIISPQNDTTPPAHAESSASYVGNAALRDNNATADTIINDRRETIAHQDFSGAPPLPESHFAQRFSAIAHNVSEQEQKLLSSEASIVTDSISLPHDTAHAVMKPHAAPEQFSIAAPLTANDAAVADTNNFSYSAPGLSHSTPPDGPATAPQSPPVDNILPLDTAPENVSNLPVQSSNADSNDANSHAAPASVTTPEDTGSTTSALNSSNAVPTGDTMSAPAVSVSAAAADDTAHASPSAASDANPVTAENTAAQTGDTNGNSNIAAALPASSPAVNDTTHDTTGISTNADVSSSTTAASSDANTAPVTTVAAADTTHDSAAASTTSSNTDTVTNDNPITPISNESTNTDVSTSTSDPTHGSDAATPAASTDNSADAPSVTAGVTASAALAADAPANGADSASNTNDAASNNTGGGVTADTTSGSADSSIAVTQNSNASAPAATPESNAASSSSQPENNVIPDSSTSSSAPAAVHIPTAPVLAVSAGVGQEDHAIALAVNLTAESGDNISTSVTISGLPAGASLSAGTQNADGSYTLTSDQLANVTLTPPLHFSGDIALQVTAVTNDNGTLLSTSSALPIAVTGIAFTPTVSTQSATGMENSAIPLHIGAALANNDAAESLSVTISGLPAGSTLSAGTPNADGSYTLTPAQLTNLTFTPPANFTGTTALSITAIAAENGTTASTASSLPLTVLNVAHAPVISMQPSTGQQDSPIALTIAVATSDNSVSETLSVSVSGVPTGASLSSGTQNNDGTWTLTPAQLTNLTLTPPLHYNGSLALSVTATASENGTSASTTTTLPVNVAGIAITPNLSVQAVSGNQDNALPLHIGAALANSDANESLSITISGVPMGATLSAGTHNADGSYTLTPAQLTNLTMTPPAHWSGSISLNVAATASENGTVATTTTTLPVTVAGVATAPSLAVTAAAGNEDTAIALHITPALLDVGNVASETLSFNISGLPSGATLSAGTHNTDGSYTLTPAQLTNLTLTPPTHWSGSISLSVAATANENGTTATTATTLPVTVIGVATAPTLAIEASSGAENTAVALNISAALVDVGSPETLAINISGVPTGGTLSAGVQNADGSWTLTGAQLTGLTFTPPAYAAGSYNLSVHAVAIENGTTATSTVSLPVTISGVAALPTLSAAAASGNENSAIALNINAGLGTNDGLETLSVNISGVPAGATLSAGIHNANGSWSLTPSQLAGLTITPPAYFGGTMALTVTAITTEPDGTGASANVPLAVTVAPVAIAPTLTTAAITGNENTAIALNISSALVDTDGSENLSIHVTGLPTGAILSAGTHNADGSYTLTPAQLTGLTVTPPANNDAAFNLTVTATSTETTGISASTIATVPVTVHGVASAPTISVANASGAANAQIPLSISGALTNNDGTESISYVLHGVPAGFALSAGSNNGDNTWTLTSAQLSGLKLITPQNFNGVVNLYATSVANETDGNVTTSTVGSFAVQVGAYATGTQVNLGVDANLGSNGLGVTVGGVSIDLFPASGGLLATGGIFAKEGMAFALNDAPSLLSLPILGALLVSKVNISGVPAGATFSAGTNMGGGVWQFTTAQLSGLTFTPPAGSDATFTLTETAKTTLGTTVSLGSTTVHVMGVATAPTLTATAGTTGLIEDHAIPVTVTSALTNTDGTENLTYEISGLPSGFTLNHGINNGNGTWSLQTADLSGLTVTPSLHYSGAVNFTVSAIATETDGSQSVIHQTVSATIAGVADAPTIATTHITGSEDQAIPINLGISLPMTDGSESISSVHISGLPTGATLSAGTHNADGSYTLTGAQLSGLTMHTATHWNGDATLTVTANSQETVGTSTNSATATVGVHVAAVAVAPITTATDATGTQDTPVTLHVGAALATGDTTDSLSVVIGGVPHGAVLSAGLNNGDGTWSLTAAQLTNLTITPPSHYSGDIPLTVTANSLQSGTGSTANTQASFTVHVAAAVTTTGGTSATWVTATDHTTHVATADLPDITATSVGVGTSDLDHLFQQQHVG